MRHALSLVFLAMVLLITSLSAATAQDWNGRWVTQGANVTNYLDLKVNGTSAQGIVSGFDKGTLSGTINGTTLTGLIHFSNGATTNITGSLQNDVLQLRLGTGANVNAVTLVRDGQPTQQPPVAAAQYYYLDAANARFGPLDMTGMQAAIGAGSVKPETLVWTAGMAGWERADAVPAIAALLAPPPTTTTTTVVDTGNYDYWLPGENEPVGPFKLADIQGKAQRGEIFSWSRIWRSDKDAWLRADAPPEVRPFFAPATAAPVVPETVTVAGFAPSLSPEQKRRTEIVLGATLGILMHEIGHALIGELGVPVTGPEEDSADEFAALLLATAFSPTEMAGEEAAVIDIAQNMVRYATLLWKRVDDAQVANNEATPWYDSHSSPSNRFRNMLCQVYGSSPETYTALADAVEFPPEEREACKFDYTRHFKAWQTIVTPFLREQNDGRTGYQPADAPGGKVTVEFRPSITATGQALLPVLEQSGMFQGLADVFEKNFVWPRDFQILFADCGEPNAFYNPDDIHVIMCWEGIEYFTGTLLDGEGVARH